MPQASKYWWNSDINPRKPSPRLLVFRGSACQPTYFMLRVTPKASSNAQTVRGLLPHTGIHCANLWHVKHARVLCGHPLKAFSKMPPPCWDTSQMFLQIRTRIDYKNWQCTLIWAYFTTQNFEKFSTRFHLKAQCLLPGNIPAHDVTLVWRHLIGRWELNDIPTDTLRRRMRSLVTRSLIS